MHVVGKRQQIRKVSLSRCLSNSVFARAFFCVCDLAANARCCDDEPFPLKTFRGNTFKQIYRSSNYNVACCSIDAYEVHIGVPFHGLSRCLLHEGFSPVFHLHFGNAEEGKEKWLPSEYMSPSTITHDAENDVRWCHELIMPRRSKAYGPHRGGGATRTCAVLFL